MSRLRSGSSRSGGSSALPVPRSTGDASASAALAFENDVPFDDPSSRAVRTLVSSGLGRSAGYPRIAATGEHLLVAWVATEVAADRSDSSRVRLDRFPLP